MLNKDNFINSLENHQTPEKDFQTLILGDKTIHNVPVIKETDDNAWVVPPHVFTTLVEIVMQYPDQDMFDYNNIKKGD